MGHGIVLVRKWLHAGVIVGACSVAACMTSSHVLVGRMRTPVSPNGVDVHLEPVSGPYETIAVVNASSRRSMSFTTVGKAEVVIARLRAEAARLGANALVVEEIGDGDAAAGGAGVAPDITRDHASLGVGLDATGLLASRYGRGVAIYIAPRDDAR